MDPWPVVHIQSVVMVGGTFISYNLYTWESCDLYDQRLLKNRRRKPLQRCYSQLVTKRSKVLDKVAVSEIGRNFLVMSAGTNIYGIGMTSAFFHMEGTDAFWMEALKIDAHGEVSTWTYVEYQIQSLYIWHLSTISICTFGIYLPNEKLIRNAIALFALLFLSMGTKEHRV